MKRGRSKVKAPDTLFLSYQKRWIEDESQIKLMEKARQIGLSWSTAYRLVRAQSQKDAPLDAWVSSRDELQAKLFLDDCRTFANLLNIGAEPLGEQVIDDAKHSAFVLRFANGKSINSMSSNADAQAGKRGSRVLDEFALHPDPRKLYSIAYPGITWGGQLEIISTHRGSGNFFNKLVREARDGGNPKRISLHRVTLQDALDAGFLAKLQAKLPAGDPRLDMDEADYFDHVRSSCPDGETFAQEFMCVPADDAAAFIDYALLDACEYLPGEHWELEPAQLKGNLWLGVDIGRENDLTVFWLMEQLGDVFFTRRIITLQRTPFSEQEQILDELLSLPGMRRCCIDQTGIGRQFAERAIQRYGSYRVEGVNFTAQSKEDMAYKLRGAFEDRKLRLPGTREVVADIRGIRKETTSAGNIRFSGERSDRGHCDRFWALALALHASSTQSTAYFTPIPVPRTDRQSRRAATRHRTLGTLS